MITDEQVEIAVEAYWSNETDELPAMRKALEAYEASKWMRFDVNDESTWPENFSYVLVKIDKAALDELGYLDTTYMGEFFNGGFELYVADECSCAVTHWQHLPTFKE